MIRVGVVGYGVTKVSLAIPLGKALTRAAVIYARAPSECTTQTDEIVLTLTQNHSKIDTLCLGPFPVPLHPSDHLPRPFTHRSHLVSPHHTRLPLQILFAARILRHTPRVLLEEARYPSIRYEARVRSGQMGMQCYV